MEKDKIKELESKYLATLEEIQTSKDIEVRHGKEDDLICKLLVELGFKKLVKKYNQSEKWYQ